MNQHQIAQALRAQASKLIAAADLIHPRQARATHTYSAKPAQTGKRVMSAAARRRISRAAKARWAALRAGGLRPQKTRKISRPRKNVIALKKVA